MGSYYWWKKERKFVSQGKCGGKGMQSVIVLNKRNGGRRKVICSSPYKEVCDGGK